MLDWMQDALGLPVHFNSKGEGGGVIQDSASSATLCAMLAARERATEGESNIRGLFGGAPLVAYGTEHAHSSLEKAARICGVGSSQLHLIEVDDQLAMRPEELDRRIREDIEAGLRPFFVNAVVGTTSTNAIDPHRFASIRGHSPAPPRFATTHRKSLSALGSLPPTSAHTLSACRATAGHAGCRPPAAPRTDHTRPARHH